MNSFSNAPNSNRVWSPVSEVGDAMQDQISQLIPMLRHLSASSVALASVEGSGNGVEQLLAHLGRLKDQVERVTRESDYLPDWMFSTAAEH